MTPPPTTTLSASVSIEALLEHRDWVRALARSLVGDEHRAEDIVQQTWLAALRNPPNQRATVRGWLATVVRNLVRDHWRKDGRRDRRERVAARLDLSDPTDVLVARADAHRRLIRAVLELPESFRTPVLMRFFEGLAPREIADHLGVPAATVRSRLHRALARLRGQLEAEDGPGVWRLALLPIPAARLLPTASAQLTGGLLVTAKKKIAIGALLMLLLGGGAWYAATLPPPAPAPDDVARAADPEPGDRERARVRPAAPTPAAETAPAAATEEPEPVVAAAPEPPPPTHTRVDFEVLGRLQPRPIPRGYKELREDEEPVIPDLEVSGRGGMVPLNTWRRWARPPDKGTATFRGRVTDGAGVPISGAQVYRVDVTKPGGASNPVSFQWVEEIATTDELGRFEATEQPARSFLIAANHDMQMNRPRGLQVSGAVPVDPAEHEVLSGLSVQLPFELSKLGNLEGRVVDADGKPLPTITEIWRGRYHRVRTKRDGTFVMKALPEGDVDLRLDATGYAVKTETLRVVGGTTKQVEIRMELAEQGPLAIRGRVLDTQDRPVADAPVFLGASFAGSRWARTDDDGYYEFANLPQAYAKKAVTVMVSTRPGPNHVLGSVVKDVHAGDHDVLIRVERTVELRTLLRDRDTGEPLPQYNVSVRAERVRDGKVDERRIAGISTYDETGTPSFWVPVGRIRLEIRAKDHEGVAIAVEIEDVDTPREVLVEMERSAE